MKTGDIMIGDWVLKPSPNDRESLFPGQIELDDFYLEEEWETITECAPIPLTEEILERNGFERTIDELHNIPIWKTPYSDGGFYIEKWGKGYVLTDHCYAVVNYVHEFQHLLKLVGINKEIKL